MDEKEKRKGKKWIIVLSVLILIAVVVTLIIVFLPKKVGNAIKQTTIQASNMFIVDDEDEELYRDFQTKVKGVMAKKYGTETDNVYEVCLVLNNVTNFYSNYIVFAEDNKTFQNNYGAIMKSYEKANAHQEKMEQVVINVNKELGSLDATFIEGAWKEFKEYFLDYLDSYTSAFKALNKVFVNCVPNGVVANDMTNLVLNCVDYYLDSITDDFSKATAKIDYLTDFSDYLVISNNNVLSQYSFNQTLQNKVALVNKFSSVYGKDKTLKTLIDGINETGFTFTSTVVDSENVLATAKTFLTGGFSA